MRSWRHAVALVLAVAFLAATAADDKRLSIYTPQNAFFVNVLERDGREYVALLDVVASLGSATARQDGDKWKLKFNNIDAEFKNEKNKAKVKGKTVEMSAPFVLDAGRGLVPLHSLGAILQPLLQSYVDVRQPARRVFIAGAGTHYTADFQGAGPKLVLHFSAPVNPSFASEPGRLRMLFNREPVIGNTTGQVFNDKTIRAANFSEHDGMAELLIQSGAPLEAALGDQNRTITITPAPQPRVQATPPPVPPPQAAPPSVIASGPRSPQEPVRPRPMVVIDPGHGGDDRGAALSDTMAEKDVALAWARSLHAALEQKGITTILLREGDISLSFDERAALANAARPLAFITLHAGATGSGMRVYTAHLGESSPRPGSFLPWDSAQGAYLDGSRSLAGNLVAEMNKRAIPVASAPVMLRPLNNVSAPAIAIELMPPGAAVTGLMSQSYQQSVCGAIADGVAATLKPAARTAARRGER